MSRLPGFLMYAVAGMLTGALAFSIPPLLIAQFLQKSTAIPFAFAIVAGGLAAFYAIKGNNKHKILDDLNLGTACVGFGGISVIIGYVILNYFFPIKPDFVDAGIVVLGAIGGYGAFHYRNKLDQAAVNNVNKK